MKIRKCATDEHDQMLLKTDPEYAKQRKKIEKFTHDWVKKYAQEGLRTGIVYIPVVVHVVWKKEVENVSDAQIQGQIDRLNIDYRRLNSDIGNVPACWTDLAADTRIEFRLAVRDPNCQATTGITRTHTTVDEFDSDLDDVKSAATGGHDAWPQDRYLNLWVCKLKGGVFGYAQFPGGPAGTDGVVIDYRYFGSINTVSHPFDLGRTATHEIGHWFNLYHIWRNSGCGTDDEVDDTPLQDIAHGGNPPFPQISCGNGPNGDMFMNYMDYTDDDCYCLFTVGQVARMDACLASARSSILASDGLIPPPAAIPADLWSADTPDDVGDEPDNASVYFYISDDIWVRRHNDGVTNQEHQDPLYGSTNYVYVRIRNRSCSSSGDGNVKLYWAKASTALGWPAPWDGSVGVPALMGDFIGEQSVTVPGRGYQILEYAWNPPNPDDYASFGADKVHFCLLSRIETSAAAPYGMAFPEGSDLGLNVKNNNNIVWKNVTIAEEDGDGGRKACVVVGRLPKQKGGQLKLVFIEPKEKIKYERTKKVPHSIFEWGKVVVDLDKVLFKRWVDAGEKGAGIKRLGRMTRIEIKERDAWIGMIKVDPGEMFTICAHFIPNKEYKESTNIFAFHVLEYLSTSASMTIGRKQRPVGGQKFVIKTIGK